MVPVEQGTVVVSVSYLVVVVPEGTGTELTGTEGYVAGTELTGAELTGTEG